MDTPFTPKTHISKRIKLWAVILLAAVILASGLAILTGGKTRLFKGSFQLIDKQNLLPLQNIVQDQSTPSLILTALPEIGEVNKPTTFTLHGENFPETPEMEYQITFDPNDVASTKTKDFSNPNGNNATQYTYTKSGTYNITATIVTKTNKTQVGPPATLLYEVKESVPEPSEGEEKINIEAMCNQLNGSNFNIILGQCEFNGKIYSSSDISELQAAIDAQSQTPQTPPAGQSEFQTLCEKLEWGEWNGSACDVNGKIASNESELKEAIKEIFKNGCEQAKGTWMMAHAKCIGPDGTEFKFDDFWNPFVKGELQAPEAKFQPTEKRPEDSIVYLNNDNNKNACENLLDGNWNDASGICAYNGKNLTTDDEIMQEAALKMLKGGCENDPNAIWDNTKKECTLNDVTITLKDALDGVMMFKGQCANDNGLWDDQNKTCTGSDGTIKTLDDMIKEMQEAAKNPSGAIKASNPVEFKALCEKIEGTEWRNGICVLNDKDYANEEQLKEGAKEIFKNGCIQGQMVWNDADASCTTPDGAFKFDDIWFGEIKGENKSQAKVMLSSQKEILKKVCGKIEILGATWTDNGNLCVLNGVSYSDEESLKDSIKNDLIAACTELNGIWSEGRCKTADGQPIPIENLAQKIAAGLNEEPLVIYSDNTDSAGTDTGTGSASIAPTVSVTASPSASQTSGQTTTFSITVTNGPGGTYNYTLDLGNGTVKTQGSTSSSATFDNIYTEAKTYTVKASVNMVINGVSQIISAPDLAYAITAVTATAPPPPAPSAEILALQNQLTAMQQQLANSQTAQSTAQIAALNKQIADLVALNAAKDGSAKSKSSKKGKSKTPVETPEMWGPPAQPIAPALPFASALIAPQAPVQQTFSQVPMYGAAPSLGYSQKLVKAPDKSNTGPEVLVYFIAVGAANAAWWIRRKIKK